MFVDANAPCRRLAQSPLVCRSRFASIVSSRRFLNIGARRCPSGSGCENNVTSCGFIVSVPLIARHSTDLKSVLSASALARLQFLPHWIDPSLAHPLSTRTVRTSCEFLSNTLKSQVSTCSCSLRVRRAIDRSTRCCNIGTHPRLQAHVFPQPKVQAGSRPVRPRLKPDVARPALQQYVSSPPSPEFRADSWRSGNNGSPRPNWSSHTASPLSRQDSRSPPEPSQKSPARTTAVGT